MTKAQNLFRRTIIVAYSIVLLLFSSVFYTRRLLLRQNYDPDEKDYTLFLFLGGCVTLVFLMLFLRKKKNVLLALHMCMLLQISYTLWEERPDSHSNEERTLIGDMAHVVRTVQDRERKIYCNHAWLYWTLDLNMNDTTWSMRIDSAHIGQALPGSIVIWDGHYNNPHYSNVPIQRLVKDTTLIPFYDEVNEYGQLMAAAFVRRYPDIQSNANFFQRMVAQNRHNAKACYYYSWFLQNGLRDIKGALQFYDTSLQMLPQNALAWYNKGLCYQMLHDTANACACMKQASQLGFNSAAQFSKAWCK